MTLLLFKNCILTRTAKTHITQQQPKTNFIIFTILTKIISKTVMFIFFKKKLAHNPQIPKFSNYCRQFRKKIAHYTFITFTTNAKIKILPQGLYLYVVGGQVPTDINISGWVS